MHRLEAVTVEFISVNMVKLIYSSHAIINIPIFSYLFVFFYLNLSKYNVFFLFLFILPLTRLTII